MSIFYNEEDRLRLAPYENRVFDMVGGDNSSQVPCCPSLCCRITR